MEGTGTKGVRLLLADPQRSLPVLALPLIVGLIVQNLNSVVDVMWVSWLGGDAIAALSLVFPMYAALTGIGAGLGIGVAAAEARAIGAGVKETAIRTAGQTFTVAFLFALVCSPPLFVFAGPMLGFFGAGDVTGEAVAYARPIFVGLFFLVLSPMAAGILRGEGATKQAMYIQALGAGVNIVLDPLLIYGCGMGVAGAAWATVVASAVPVLLCLLCYRKDQMYLRLRKRDLRPDLAIQKGILTVGFPQAAEYAVMALCNIFLNWAVLAVGGTNAVGIYTSAWRVGYLALIPAQALGGAVVSVCAAEAGGRRYQLVRRAFRFSVCRSVLYTAFCALVLAVGAGAIAWVFTQAADLVPLRTDMRNCLLFLALLLPVMSLVYMGSAFLQALCRSGVAFYSSLIRNAVMAVGYFIAARTFGTLLSIWAAMAAVEIFGGLLMAYLAWHVLRGVLRQHPADTVA
ncbi:MAG: MATE family efflux transporter [Candidatus Methanomethylophilus sp.]|nr:MATE family efflux transporter [Methanomethylophilus sp.]